MALSLSARSCEQSCRRRKFYCWQYSHVKRSLVCCVIKLLRPTNSFQELLTGKRFTISIFYWTDFSNYDSIYSIHYYFKYFWNRKCCSNCHFMCNIEFNPICWAINWRYIDVVFKHDIKHWFGF